MHVCIYDKRNVYSLCMCINRCKCVHTHRDILILPSEVSSTLGLQTLKRQKPKPFNPKLKRPQTVKPEVRKT